MARQKMLFMDWRDIQCGHLRWRTEDGTQLEATATWGGQTDLGAPEGKPVALHLQLRRAEVFSVGFA